MTDINHDGYDDLTHQQNPVLDPKVANTVPRGTGGSILTNDSLRVSPRVDKAWYDRTPAETAAWKKENFNLSTPVSAAQYADFKRRAGGKAGGIDIVSRPGASVVDKEIANRIYGLQPFSAPHPFSGAQFRSLSTQSYRPASWKFPDNTSNATTISGPGLANERQSAMQGGSTVAMPTGKEPTSFTDNPETIREIKNANRVGSTNVYDTDTIRENYSPMNKSLAQMPVNRGVTAAPSIQTNATASVTSPIKPPTAPVVAAPAERGSSRGN